MEGKIYRLQGDDGSFYIGSCFISLTRRLSMHKYDCNRSPTRKISIHFNTIGWDKINIILIKEINCDTKEQLRILEQEEIDKHKQNPQCLNSYNSFGQDKERKILTDKRLYEQNKEAIRKRHLEYQKNHRDEANRRTRESRQRKRDFEASKNIGSLIIEDAIR